MTEFLHSYLQTHPSLAHDGGLFIAAVILLFGLAGVEEAESPGKWMRHCVFIAVLAGLVWAGGITLLKNLTT